MCVVCYLSTDRVIPEIPFDTNAGDFNIERLEERPTPALSKKFVYYCGSSTCCGCGFDDEGISETVLQRTENEISHGQLSEETAWLWWDQQTPPPQNKGELEKTARRVRDAHRDAEKLYQLIRETCQSGFSCELLACWSGDENQPVSRTVDVDLNQNEIEVDFRCVLDTSHSVLLYRFFK